jgi:translation initiation factor IF-1
MLENVIATNGKRKSVHICNKMYLHRERIKLVNRNNQKDVEF